jgi:hypothetical protein
MRPPRRNCDSRRSVAKDVMAPADPRQFPAVCLKELHELLESNSVRASFNVSAQLLAIHIGMISHTIAYR